MTAVAAEAVAGAGFTSTGRTEPGLGDGTVPGGDQMIRRQGEVRLAFQPAAILPGDLIGLSAVRTDFICQIVVTECTCSCLYLTNNFFRIFPDSVKKYFLLQLSL